MKRMIYLFSVAYLAAASIYLAIATLIIARQADRHNTLKRRLRKWRRCERIAATSAYADNLPPPDVHPQCRSVVQSVVQPAYVYDASDTTEEGKTYCPVCALRSVAVQDYRTADDDYPLPRGRRVLCRAHTAEWEQRLEGDVL